VKVLAYNTEGGLGDHRRRDKILEFVTDAAPDVAFFSEATSFDTPLRDIEIAIAGLRSLGYHVTHGSNADIPPRSDARGFIGIVREGLGEGRVISSKTRQGFAAVINSSEFNRPLEIIGQHFDDRNSRARLRQLFAQPLVDVLLGDYNDMDRDALIARLVRMLDPLTRAFPEIDPDFNVTTNWLLQRISLAQRSGRMAHGKLIEAVKARGLHDADPTRQPTIGGVFQIDHIMIAEDLIAEHFTVHKDMKLSDHKPISATIRQAADVLE
jgi:endonuclease/exonuclease/phosphatase family metal-dependent hydrolase